MREWVEGSRQASSSNAHMTSNQPSGVVAQVGDVMACTVEQARAAAAEADSAAQMARVFEASGRA